MGQSVRVRWVILVALLPAVAYGLLNLLTPRTTIAWQRRSTARHEKDDPRSRVGSTFQQWIRDDPAADPSGVVVRRVRLIGLGEIAIAVVVILIVFGLS
jgi:hypothetical protein